MIANCAFAMAHSRGGILHSFCARFNTRKRSFSALSSVGKWPRARTARRNLAFNELDFLAPWAFGEGVHFFLPRRPWPFPRFCGHWLKRAKNRRLLEASSWTREFFEAPQQKTRLLEASSCEAQRASRDAYRKDRCEDSLLASSRDSWGSNRRGKRLSSRDDVSFQDKRIRWRTHNTHKLIFAQ